jgi:hypothetical protein
LREAGPLPPEALERLEAARRAAARSRWDEAAAAASEAWEHAPWSADLEWLRAVAIETRALSEASPSPEDMGAAGEAYFRFRGRHFTDGRAEEAGKRQQRLGSWATALRLKPVRSTRRVESSRLARGNRPLPIVLGAPNLYLDLGGATVGGRVTELHALKAVVFIPRARLGFGAAAFSRHRTPFEMSVDGLSERADLNSLLPLEVVFAPLNVKAFGNTVISPQLYYGICPWSFPSSKTLSMGNSAAGAVVQDMGVRVPLGALAGLRAGWLKAVSRGGEIGHGGRSYGGFRGSAVYAGVDLYLGAMFGLPLPPR